MNRTLLKIIKAKLDDAKGAWTEEMPSTRREMFHEGNNDDQLWVNLDCLDEVREKAFDKMTKYQQKMAEYYNKRVKLRQLDIGDHVLGKVTLATRDSA